MTWQDPLISPLFSPDHAWVIPGYAYLLRVPTLLDIVKHIACMLSEGEHGGEEEDLLNL